MLDVYGFLNIECLGNTLLGHILAGDQGVRAALATDPVVSLNILEGFQRVAEGKKPLRASTLCKQLYWLWDDDPTNNSSFHLLGPLYSSSLAHYARLRSNTEGSIWSISCCCTCSKKAGQDCADEIHEYPGLAVQILGGSNKAKC